MLLIPFNEIENLQNRIKLRLPIKPLLHHIAIDLPIAARLKFQRLARPCFCSASKNLRVFSRTEEKLYGLREANFSAMSFSSSEEQRSVPANII